MGRPGRWIIISLVALLVLVVAADRVGDAVAERLAADALQSSQHLAQRPEVDIAGFPFLTQLASGHYGKITVTATDVALGPNARGLLLNRLVVVLHGLSVTRSFSHFHADTASATGTIDLDQLATVLGGPVGYAGNGRLELARRVAGGGRSSLVRATAKPRLRHGELTFTDISVVGGNGPRATSANRLTSAFALAIPLQSIPFGIRLKSVSAGSEGLTVTLAGRDLVYDK
jgi:hypothetical protein